MDSKSKNSVPILTFLSIAYCWFGLYAQNTPRTYVAHKITESIEIDGKANEVSWKKATWSDNYVDIEGKKKPGYGTRTKMMWDHENLYVFSEMVEPHIWANLKQRDTVIFYNNDFEIFIDPDGDTHNYYEFEINALNTVWDLFLTKPYRNHGTVLEGWDFKGLKSAVHINGTLNDPLDIDEKWSVEIAIPWKFTSPPDTAVKIPENEYWRMNFSRVNWDFDLTNGRYSRKKDEAQKYLPEYNWVWSPQGVVNMHEPEHWGYVYFSTKKIGSPATFKIPEDERIKWYLYKLFRQYHTRKEAKNLAQGKKILGETVYPKILEHQFGWTIWAISPFTNKKLSIREDGKFETVTME